MKATFETTVQSEMDLVMNARRVKEAVLSYLHYLENSKEVYGKEYGDVDHCQKMLIRHLEEEGINVDLFRGNISCQ